MDIKYILSFIQDDSACYRAALNQELGSVATRHTAHDNHNKCPPTPLEPAIRTAADAQSVAAKLWVQWSSSQPSLHTIRRRSV